MRRTPHQRRGSSGGGAGLSPPSSSAAALQQERRRSRQLESNLDVLSERLRRLERQTRTSIDASNAAAAAAAAATGAGFSAAPHTPAPHTTPFYSPAASAAAAAGSPQLAGAASMRSPQLFATALTPIAALQPPPPAALPPAMPLLPPVAADGFGAEIVLRVTLVERSRVHMRIEQLEQFGAPHCFVTLRRGAAWRDAWRGPIAASFASLFGIHVGDAASGLFAVPEVRQRSGMRLWDGGADGSEAVNVADGEDVFVYDLEPLGSTAASWQPQQPLQTRQPQQPPRQPRQPQQPPPPPVAQPTVLSAAARRAKSQPAAQQAGAEAAASTIALAAAARTGAGRRGDRGGASPAAPPPAAPPAGVARVLVNPIAAEMVAAGGGGGGGGGGSGSSRSSRSSRSSHSSSDGRGSASASSSGNNSSSSSSSSSSNSSSDDDDDHAPPDAESHAALLAVLASTMQHLSGSGGAGAAEEEEEEGYEQGLYDVLLDKRPPAGLGIYFVGEDDAEGSFVDPEEPFVAVARGEVNAAAASGAIRGGDELISVNGQDVSYLPFAVVVELLRELPPGRCSLRLRRAADDELGGGDGDGGGGGGGGGLRGQGAEPRSVEFSVRLDRARGSGLCIAFSEEQGRVVVDREEPFLPRADGGVGPAEASGEIRCVPCCACSACALAFALR